MLRKISFVLIVASISLPISADPGATVYISESPTSIQMRGSFGIANSKYNIGTEASRDDLVAVSNNNAAIVSIWGRRDERVVNGTVQQTRKFFSCYVNPSSGPQLWETAQIFSASVEDGTSFIVSKDPDSNKCTYIQLDKSSYSVAGSGPQQ